ncbi:MAG: hypothetical protein KGP27_04435 [Hyphomicrobiales bacterium]|nr:hypothetical protein [Hyphomicrobiales bacterium]
MADGSQAARAEISARNAAADVARDVQAEVEAQAAPIRKHANSSRAVDTAKPFHEFIVDVWITNFNSVEFGIYKHSRNKAKSRQFTSDMDIFAEVIENGERTGLLGYREELWKKNTGMDKRLVFKLFNEGLNWRATMDLMLGRSLQLTIGARGLPVLAYSCNVGEHAFMVYVERSANKWPFMPENYSFFILEDGRPEFYRLRQDFLDIAGDYTLYNERNEKIGRINGRLFTIGGYWKGRVKTEHADARLMMVLQLFCGMISFNRGAKRHMRRLSRDVMSGKLEPRLEKQEADLYMNPRRVR